MVRGQGRQGARRAAHRGARDADLLRPSQGHGRRPDGDHGDAEGMCALSEYRTIRADLADGVLTITLNRPERMNALTPTLLAEATAAVDEGIAQGARVLLLTGEGRAFCSGADLVGEGGDALPEDLGELVERHYNPFVEKIAGLDIPV